MSKAHKEVTERLANLVKKAKKSGQDKQDISPTALERIADEFGLPIETVHEILHSAEVAT